MKMEFDKERRPLIVVERGGYEGVRRIAGKVAADFERVAGFRPEVVTERELAVRAAHRRAGAGTETQESVTPEAPESVKPDVSKNVTPEIPERMRPEESEDVTPEAPESVKPEAPERAARLCGTQIILCATMDKRTRLRRRDFLIPRASEKRMGRRNGRSTGSGCCPLRERRLPVPL